jgi:hypothetical protein
VVCNMSRKFLVGIDLNKNELQNAVIQNLGTAPSSPLAGQIYFDTVDNELYYYTGTTWESTQANAQVTYGLLAGRPAAGEAGRLYYATDNYLLYFDDGSTWTQINNFGTVTAQTTYGATSGNGSSTNFARADHTHGTPPLTNTTPQALAIGANGAVGTGAAPAREDHVHEMPDFGNVSAQTTFGASSGNGSSADVARADHTHGTPAHDNAAHSAINLSALAVPTANVPFATYKITGLGNPTDDQDAATKYYVDQAVQGLTWKVAANLLSVVNAPLTGATGTLNIDTYGALTSADAGYRIVLTNQTTDADNGIYVYADNGTNYTLTRSTDGNPYTELIGATIYIQEGTTKAGTSWSQSNHYLTSFADQEWVQIAGVGIYTAGNGIAITDNVIAADPGTGITVDGSGINIDTAVVVTKYAANVGNGSATSYTITHNLGTRDVIVSVYDNASPYAEVICDVQHSSTTAITLLFSVAPTSNQYRVVVHA